MLPADPVSLRRRPGDHRRLVAAAAAVMFLVVACSGEAPAPTGSFTTTPPAVGRCAGKLQDQALAAYTPPSRIFTLAVPRHWTRTRIPDGIAFTHRLESIKLEQVPYGSPSTTASFRTNELPGLRQATPGFRLRGIDAVALPAGPAVLAQYAETVADGPTGAAVERDVQRYELWHADQRMVITLASPCEDDAAPLWRRITESFRWRR